MSLHASGRRTGDWCLPFFNEWRIRPVLSDVRSQDQDMGKYINDNVLDNDGIEPVTTLAFHAF